MRNILKMLLVLLVACILSHKRLIRYHKQFVGLRWFHVTWLEAMNPFKNMGHEISISLLKLMVGMLVGIGGPLSSWFHVSFGYYCQPRLCHNLPFLSLFVAPSLCKQPKWGLKTMFLLVTNVKTLMAKRSVSIDFWFCSSVIIVYFLWPMLLTGDNLWISEIVAYFKFF